VLALAKDLARLVIDRIDISVLRRVASPLKGENWGSLKSLEKALATVTGAEEARAALAPLVGTYELRLDDAHLPSSTIDDAFALAGLNRSTSPLQQGRALLEANAIALQRITALVDSVAPEPPPTEGT